MTLTTSTEVWNTIAVTFISYFDSISLYVVGKSLDVVVTSI